MKLNFKIFFLFLLLSGSSYHSNLFAQTEPEDVAVNEDKFQDSFYEAIKQKGIENYDKAIDALEKCEKEQPNNPVVFFEMGKNYFYQKKYSQAYENFEKAYNLDTKNRWFLNGMYDVTYETKDYNKSIELVLKLIPFDASIKEDLVSLYMYTAQFDKALSAINELNETVGVSDKRELYKAQILQSSKYQGSEKDNLLSQIRKFPQDEANYISLIYLYSNSNQEEKALDLAKQLEKAIPTSDWAQVSLFKYNLTNNDAEKAINSMNTVLKSNKIDSKIKHRVLNEFLIYSIDKPQYDGALEKAISYFDDDKSVKVNKEIGKFFFSKNNFLKAVSFFEKDNVRNPDDLETVQLLLDSYFKNNQFAEMAKKAEAVAELFPLQPILYYYAGLGFNQTKNFKKAKDLLETGIDYVIDDKSLEQNFYIQLAESFDGLGDIKKKDSYLEKATQLAKKK
jgi:tetratricopeptide (TPR) repeat protein